MTRVERRIVRCILTALFGDPGGANAARMDATIDDVESTLAHADMLPRLALRTMLFVMDLLLPVLLGFGVRRMVSLEEETAARYLEALERARGPVPLMIVAWKALVAGTYLDGGHEERPSAARRRPLSMHDPVAAASPGARSP